MDPATWLLLALALAGAVALAVVARARRERQREERLAWGLVERGFDLRGDPLVSGVIEGYHAGKEARVTLEREGRGWVTRVALAGRSKRLKGRVRDPEKILTALRSLERETAER